MLRLLRRPRARPVFSINYHNRLPAVAAAIATGTTTTKFLRNMASATSASDNTQYTLTFYVPQANTKSVLAAVHSTGAGAYPGALYDQCAFITAGTGTFRPLAGAKPAIGSVGDVEMVEEDRVEVLCVGGECMRNAVRALKTAHPYEQVAYFVVKGEQVE